MRVLWFIRLRAMPTAEGLEKWDVEARDMYYYGVINA